jgi:DNA-binding CsgD family transcriptional regulator
MTEATGPAAREPIGRAELLAAVRRLISAIPDGPGGLVLEGTAGIGKTTIVEAALDSAAAAGIRILHARPAESERDLTLGGLTDLLAGIGDDMLDELPAPQRRSLAVALLRTEDPSAPNDQRTLSVAATGLFRQLAGTGAGLLLAIDDAQWLDSSSAAILAYGLRRLGDRPVGVLLSVRTGSGVPASTADLLAALSSQTERVEIGPMALASLHQLFEQRLGRSFPRLTLVRIEEASGGNPFYALEIARSLIRQGAVVTPGRSLPVPGTIGGLTSARIAGLPAPTRRALLLAAASSQPTLATLRRADPDVTAALVPARDDGVISTDDGIIRFVHPLFAQAVIGSADTDELFAVHAALAAAADSADARARHAGQAARAPDQAVATQLEDAAAAARMRGATLDASALYVQASRLTPDVLADEAIRRVRLAAECLFIDVSEIVEADALLGQALPRARPGPERAEAMSLRAIIWYYHGRPPEAVELCELALAEAGTDPETRARVLVRLAFLTCQLDVPRGLSIVSEAMRLLEALGPTADHDLLANGLLLRASLRLGLVEPMDPDDVERGTALISANGRSWERENADGLAFGIARMTDRLDRAIEMTEELIRAKSGVGWDDPFNLVQLSGLLCLRGRLPEARQVAEAALDAYDREGTNLMPSWRLRGVALVAAHDGRTDEARQLATEGLDLALADGNLVIATFHCHILGFVALSLDEYEVADAQLTAAAELAARTGHRHPARFKLEGDRIEAALARGRVDEAERIVAVMEHAARTVPTPWVRAIGPRCRALLDVAHGDLESALTALELALVEHEALPMPFERARTLLVKGQVHRRRKEKRRASETLREALALFEELGTPVWAQRTRIELARVGLRPTAPDSLTSTERRVAELAASGLNSRRIGEMIFLTPKSVGNVLSRVYEKLGIHSRAELGARMADHQAQADPGTDPQ